MDIDTGGVQQIISVWVLISNGKNVQIGFSRTQGQFVIDTFYVLRVNPDLCNSPWCYCRNKNCKCDVFYLTSNF